MNQQEFAQIATAIRTFYPREDVLRTEQAMEMWFEMLKDLDYRAAQEGLKRYVADNRFPPTVSDIRENALAFTGEEPMNETEAWGLVAKALRNCGYGYLEEFAKLPKIVQYAVGTPEQLHYWATDENFNEEVAKATFVRVYRQEVKDSRMMEKMPDSLKAEIEKSQENSDKSNLRASNTERVNIYLESLKSANRGILDAEKGIPATEEILALIQKIGGGGND